MSSDLNGMQSIPAHRATSLLRHSLPMQETQSDETASSDDQSSPRAVVNDGFLINVPLPITQEVDSQVRRMIDRVVARLPQVAAASERPVIVLEFDTSDAATGEGSQLERCLALARYLSGPDLSRVRTVAYVPEPRGVGYDDENRISQLRGHAVLVAIACEEIILHEQASLGAAGIDESRVDDLIVAAYQSIADRRRTLPLPMVMALLDRQQSLHRVTTSDGTLLLDESALSDLEAEGRVIDSITLSEQGSFPEFTSEELASISTNVFRVGSRLDIARRMNIREDALQGDPSLGDEWRAVKIQIHGPIVQQDVGWWVEALTRAVEADDANLVIVDIESSGGSLADAIRMAQLLADFEPTDVRTVAYVANRARGGAAIIALACDHLVMKSEAQLGGPAEPVLEPDALEPILPSLKSVASARQTDWTRFVAVIDPTLTISRYRHTRTGRIQILSTQEHATLEDKELWVPLSTVEFADGLNGDVAERLGYARYLVSGFDELRSYYQLTSDPELLEPSATHQWIERLGRRLSSPWIAGWLLFAAMLFLSTELSQPGLGVPGFVSAICFCLFFWSQYCDGNVQWFEILLLIVGAIFVLLEVFVLPGFGVFGVGGILMVVTALFLAMQSFVLPKSSEEIQQLPQSFAVVSAGLAGVFVAFIVVRRFLPNIPVLNKIVLTPPAASEKTFSNVKSGDRSDQILVDQVGTTVTRLAPAGKIRIGNRMLDVVTDGRFINKGESVVVHEVHGNRIIVMPIDRRTTASAPTRSSHG